MSRCAAVVPRSIAHPGLPLLLVIMAIGGLLVGAGRAGAATTAPTFARANYPSLANSNVVADFNGDGRLDLAGIGFRSAAVLLATGDGTFGARVEFPPAPSLLSPAQDAQIAQPVRFDWSDVTAATAYQIQIDDSDTFSAPVVVNQTVTVSQFTAPTLASRRHWWRVRGINSAGVSGPWSSVRRLEPRPASE